MRKGERMSEESKLKLMASKARRRELGVRPNRFRRPIADNGDGTAMVRLTKGFAAIIDSADIDIVAGWNWYADVRPHTIYAVRHNSNGTHSYLHHVILGSTQEVDHSDGNGLNNRRSNLRHCSGHSQNNANMRPRTRRFKGVDHQSENSWAARTKVSGRSVHIGNYSSPQEAACAYDDFVHARFGEFAKLNFPERYQ